MTLDPAKNADRAIAQWALAKIAVRAPHALRLAAQLFGIAPCEHCDYLKYHCRCYEAWKGTQ